MKRNFTFLLLCLCVFFAHAQQISQTTAVINGCAKGAENRVARLYLEDAITKFQWKIDEQPIGNDGCFVLTAEIPQTQKAFIKIDFYQTYIFLEPTRVYNITFDEFDFRIDERINPFRLDQFLSYRFDEPDSNELNRLIWRFENMFDEFLKRHLLFQEVDAVTRELYINFRNQVRSTFAFSGHGYFNDYLTYALADMERIFNLTSPANLFLRHIQDKPILYNNEAYADFITEYYSGYFPFSIRYNRNVFVDQINRADNLTAIMDSLGRDTTLQNEKLREFVFLLGLRELYNSPEFSNSSILRLLLDIQSTTKFPEHAKLVDFIIQKLQRFESGINKANFKFWDPVRNIPYDFSESSKFKYVIFVNGLCESCEMEISIMRGIAENLSHSVDFYIVNCDYEVNRALRNMPRDLGKITYLHFNRDFETLEKLGIVDFPIAVWLDSENIIQSYYFLLPSRRAERAIQQLFR